jgi:stage II sporulation protein AA (anti-sigma F factor antagonist)
MTHDESDLQVEYFDSVPVVHLAGEIDVVQARRLRDRLLTIVRNRDAGLVVDLSEVRYIDSSGVNVMFELAERLAEGQIEFGVVVPEGGLVERVLEIVDMGSVASLHRSVDEGVGTVSGRA